MSIQFATTTLEDAKNLHEIGFLNSVGLTYFYFQIKLKGGDDGWEHVFDPKEVCQELGVSKASFYRALSMCRVHGILEFEAVGKIKIKNLKAPPDKGCLKTKTVSQNCNNPVKTETTASKLKQSRQNCDDNFKTETETPLKPLPGESSGVPSYSSQIDLKSSSSSDQILRTTEDDDDGLILKKEEKTEEDVMMDFDLWMKRIKVPELIADGVKKPQAYLKSLDKATGQPLIEKYRAEWEQLKSATLQTRALVNIKPKFPIGTMVYHWNSGYSGQIVSYPHQKRAMVSIGEDTLLFPVEELHTEPDDRPVPTYASLREALASQFPELSARVKS
jgi:hypothetical protein